MKKLNKFKLYIVSAFIILSSTLFFTGCGKRYMVNISNETPEGYTVSDSQEVKGGEKFEIYVNALEGYSLDNIIVKVNNSAVEGVVRTNINGEDIVVSDETGINYGRTWSYTINKVSSDIDIFVDFSDCGLIDCTITLSGLENQNAFYAISVGPDNQSSTVLNSSSISQPQAFVSNQAQIKYGESLYILLNEKINLSALNSNENFYYQLLTKYGGEYYKYNGKFVYYFRDVKGDLTIGKALKNNQNNIYTTEQLATIAFKGIGSDAVNLEYYGHSLNTEPTGSITGAGLFWHSYLYLGDKNKFEDEQIESSLIEESLRIMGKKAYYRLSLNPNFYNSDIEVKDVASFYLVENIDEDTTNLTELTIKKDSISEYLEIEKSDIEQFISDNTAGLYLKTVIKEDALINDYFGLQLNYVNNDLNTGVEIYINESHREYASYLEFLEDDELIYYFHKSQLYNDEVQNAFNISFGNSNYYGDMPYILATEFRISRLNSADFIFSKMIDDYPADSVYDGKELIENHEISLIENEKNIFEITVKTTYQSPDASNHQVGFNAVFDNDYKLSKPIYIANSITNPEWIELTEDNLPQLNNLTISASEPLYVYSYDYASLPLELYDGNMKLVSAYSLVNDVRGNAIMIYDDYDNYCNVYALYLNKLYIPADTSIEARINNIDI